MRYRTEADFPVLIRPRTVSFVRVADQSLGEFRGLVRTDRRLGRVTVVH